MANDGQQSTTSIRMSLGPLAKAAVEGVDSSDRADTLDRILQDYEKLKASSKVQAGSGPQQSTPDHVPPQLLDFLDDVIMSIEDLTHMMNDRFDQNLAEHSANRGLMGTLLTEDDERAALIERVQLISDERQLGVDAIKAQLGIREKARRQSFKELVTMMTPVIAPEATHEQADKAMVKGDGGDRER